MSPDAVTYAYLRRINRLLTALSRVNQTILRVRDDRTQLLNDASRIICDQLSYDLVWLGEINRRGEVVRGASQSAADIVQTDPSTAGAETIPPATMSRLRDIAIRAAEVYENVVHEPLAELPHKSEALTWRASAFPARVNNNSTFVLVACSHTDEGLEAEEIEILEELAHDLGFAIETMEVESRTHQAESALRISEERFRRLAENSMAGIVLIQNDLYRYVNPAFADIFGYASPGEIIDRLGPTDLAAPESRDLVRDNVQRRILGQVRSVHYQYRGLRKNGTTFDVEEYGARTIHAQRLAVIATVLDVTSREASRSRLEALSEAGLALSTAQTVQHALNNAAQQVARILPCDAADIVLFRDPSLQIEAHAHAGNDTATIPKMVSRGIPIEEIPGFGQIVELRQSTVVNSVELLPIDSGTFPPRDAREYVGAPLIVRGQLIGLLVAEAEQRGRFSDEDARHLRLFADHVAATLQHLRLISSLEEERNRLRTLNRVSHTLSETLQLQEVASRALGEIGRSLNADISLLYLWDGATQRLTAVAAEGVSQSRLTKLNIRLVSQGAAIAKLLTNWDRKDVDMPLARFREWESVRELEEGTVLPTQSKMRSALDVPLEAHGEFIGALSFSSSRPSGFTAADAELVRALSVQVALAIQNARFYERAARQAEAMANALHRQEELDVIKDELIQNISHELRTPLALVMGYAEMLDSGQLGPLEEEQATAIGVITRRSRMLRSLVEDIALLWHLERQVETKETVDLRALVETTVTEFRTQAQEQGLTLASTLPDRPVEIHGVPVQIRRVLDNLIGNSLKFTPVGGEIRADLAIVDGCAELAVTDSGIGVPQEKLQRIFERFYQVDGSPRRKYGGTGLGLALVKAIAEAHQGTVHAISPVSDDPENPGTRIAIRLPIPENNEPPPDPGPRSQTGSYR
ncbi:MAG: GAF domain-containing protein [Anaerolineae bacterium]|nr:GAF domain-containing protein [Anaerolineae bacterium]